MRLLCAVLLTVALFAARPARAQDDQAWRSDDGVFSLTIPYMWNPGDRPAPEVLLFLRSLQLGPAGPAQIVCSIENAKFDAEAVFTRGQLDALMQENLNHMAASETDPVVATEMVNGVLVGGLEVAGMSDRLHERRFMRMFLMQQGMQLTRYMAVCAVRTGQPATDTDFAVTRAFLASLQINTD